MACDVRIVGELGDLGHLGTCGAPWVVTCRCAVRQHVLCDRVADARRAMWQNVVDIPSRTFTWTLEYPLVMFFTPRITFDMFAVGTEDEATGQGVAS